ncbi:protein-tyrosine-phosphatase [Frankia sp. QA3]|nr:protein-tyrosine-phosphatase [Frankia sp. QA3]
MYGRHGPEILRGCPRARHVSAGQGTRPCGRRQVRRHLPVSLRVAPLYGSAAFVPAHPAFSDAVAPMTGRAPSPPDSLPVGLAPLRHAHPGVGVARPPEVLFVCVHNAGRSQMGAALLDQHGRGRVQARSAGTAPAATLHLPVVAAMAEVGIDLSGACPTRLTDDAVRAASVVISMGCADTVPIYPHTRYLTWELDDPAEKPLEDVRPIRDEIDSRVRSLLYSLGVAARVGLLREQPDPDQPDPDQPVRGAHQPTGNPAGPRRPPAASPRPRPHPGRPPRPATRPGPATGPTSAPPRTSAPPTCG